jgi:hypothetical protein
MFQAAGFRGRTAPAIAVWCLMPLLIAAWSERARAIDKQAATTSGSIQVLVLDAEGAPLPKAKVSASVWTTEEFKHNRDYVCDEAGRAEVQLPKTLTILRIWAYAPGHAGMFFNWNTNPQAETPLVPKEYTVRLHKGTVLGGLVKDEEGRQIKGVRVELDYDSNQGQENPRPTMSGAKLTDADGRWR